MVFAKGSYFFSHFMIICPYIPADGEHGGIHKLNLRICLKTSLKEFNKNGIQTVAVTDEAGIIGKQGKITPMIEPDEFIDILNDSRSQLNGAPDKDGNHFTIA